ncbi:MAG: cell division protein FtsA [Clostridia bacterium]|nr:cell division protein FtsA [Clostridia bacterium]MDD4375330.1 cell division protein FtsA [Clostridia bacterium]
MAIGDIIVSLDIGASKSAAVVGQVNKFNEIEVIGYGLSDSEGISKGRIINKEEVSKSIIKAITEAEETSGLYINSSYVNIKGLNVRIERIKCKGYVQKPDDGLSAEDIYRLFEQVQAATRVKDNEQMIDLIPYKYVVNDREYKEEPIGAFTKEFSADIDVVIANGEFIKDIVETLNMAELKIDGVILETLATSNIVLMPEEKQMGVLMLDIGASHTDISVYKESRLEFYETLPIGGNHITNDIAMTLNISYEEAERLKRQYNLAIEAMISNNHEIKLNTNKSDKAEDSKVRCSDIVKVIEARVKEIYQIIRKILADNNMVGKYDCLVLTGQGISNIVGSEELAVLTLKVGQVRICSPKLINVIKPQHTVAFGMVKYIAGLGLSKHVNSNVEIVTEPGIKEKVIDFLKETKERFKNILKKDETGI